MSSSNATNKNVLEKTLEFIKLASNLSELSGKEKRAYVIDQVVNSFDDPFIKAYARDIVPVIIDSMFFIDDSGGLKLKPVLQTSCMSLFEQCVLKFKQ